MSDVEAHIQDLTDQRAELRVQAQDLIEENARLRRALRDTHGTAQLMADMDSWIAERCGMESTEDGLWYVPSARAALGEA